MEALIVAVSRGVAGSCDDTNFNVLLEEIYELLACLVFEMMRKVLPRRRGITGLVGSRLSPSSYNVTSPSKVASCSAPLVTAMVCAELRICRTSLNDGATNLLDEMYRFLSWYLKAASRGSLVKKGPAVGTSILSLEGKLLSLLWRATRQRQISQLLREITFWRCTYCGHQS